MPDSALKQQITDAMKDAMRAKDKIRLGTIRLALAEIKKIEVDERIEPDDARITGVLDKMIKQRRESVKQYESAGRTDLAEQEEAEIAILQDFMPQALSEAEISAILDAAVAETGASGMADMGKVMAIVRPAVLGRADMAAISQQIKQRLS
ncbi:MAG: GatB/YqeY domain-containing protein [Pseudomonadales bacterium]|nr:GatB/YqeY domain-containing protein [Pseudomonadales bacterium]MCP5329564.1 GatB/YqeY domain-containing protein [Pseudomonadales bacterium]MCP5343897.1 GatB/YqeY domain-containing protein [Pseudomonadales bacterium]